MKQEFMYKEFVKIFYTNMFSLLISIIGLYKYVTIFHFKFKMYLKVVGNLIFRDN